LGVFTILMKHKKFNLTKAILLLFLGTSLVNAIHLDLNNTTTIRIMPLGDSITFDQTSGEKRPTSKRSGYRSHLWYSLKKSGYKVDFVGSQTAGSAIKPPFDTHNEGHPGWNSYEIANKAYSYMVKAKPNIVLLHAGTNDHSTSIKGMNSLLNEIDIYESNSQTQVRVIVALIINRRSGDLIIEGFNKKLKKLIQERWENGDIISTVNMFKDTKLTKEDYYDNTHPNSKGYKKMAKVWHKALTTPYLEYTSAPTAKDDKASGETGTTIHINVRLNDTDRQNDMNISTVHLVGGTDTDGDMDADTLDVTNQGKWSVDNNGTVTFVPKKGFTSDPTPITYTIKDDKGEVSEPAKISIDYINTTLNNFPSSLTTEEYIESVIVNEASNSIEVIVRVPNTGITF